MISVKESGNILLKDNEFNLLVGEEALLVDLCKLKMGSAKKAYDILEAQSSAKNLYYGYVFGYHDFIIVKEIQNMDMIYDRSNIDLIEPLLNSHHRFFIYSWNAAKPTDKGGICEKKELLLNKELFENSSLISTVLLNMNYNKINHIIHSEQNYGFISTLRDFIAKTHDILIGIEGIDVTVCQCV